MLSVVIPLQNEVESLATLHAELAAVAEEQRYALEMIFVDDGSADGSWAEIQRLAAADARVRGIRFRRNFGKAAALDAGFAAARGSLIFTLDGDLQDDPQEIPRFIEAMEQGGAGGTPLDVVSGWKRVRHDPWHKVGPSRVFNWLVSFLTGVRLHDHNCGFKCYRRQVFDEVRLYGEMHRFVPVLAAARGWRVGEIVVHHRPRKFGRSKYGVGRIVKGLLDLLTVYFLTGYGRRPQHLLGTIGLIGFVFGGLGMLFLTLWWIVSRLDADPHNNLHLHERAVFYYSMGAMLLGGQFLSVGLLAEMLTAYCAPESAAYSVQETVGDTEMPPQFDPPFRDRPRSSLPETTSAGREPR